MKLPAADRSGSFPSAGVRVILSIAAGLLIAGCGDNPTAPHPDKVFADSQRASCPESPFRPEFPMTPKLAARSQVISFHAEIYTSQGVFVNQWDGEYDPQAVNTRGPTAQIEWDGRDASGKEAASGYYFWVVKLMVPNSTTSETRIVCVFWINQADQDKVK